MLQYNQYKIVVLYDYYWRIFVYSKVCCEVDVGESMFIFRLVRRLVLIICIVFGAIYAYDTYQSYQGTNRVSKAHTSVEQVIENNEDTLSRWDRVYRVFTFKEKVERALNQRVPKDKWIKSESIPDNAKRALVAIEDKRYYKHG